MAASTIRPGAPEWRSGPDGTGHAIRLRGDHRYACGEIVLDIRWAHPVERRCVDCLAVVGIEVTVRAPLPIDPLAGWEENEKREAWGGR